MSTKHTKTPWHTEPYGEKALVVYRKPRPYGGGVVALVESDNPQADAAFIVQACNAHEELVGFLRDVIKADMVLSPAAASTNLDELARTAQAILAKLNNEGEK